MSKKSKFRFGVSIESQILVVLLVLIAGVLVAGWGAAMNLRQTVATNASVMNVDSSALIEIEHLRNVAESQIANSRSYFLMGSKSIFDKQEAEKKTFTDSLAKLESTHALPQVSGIIEKIRGLQKQEAEFFEQGMAYRAKNEESKIVGQFYQSKTAPLVTQLNQNLDELIKIHNADLAKARENAKKAGLDAQAMIPQGMTWFTAAIAGLAFCFALLVLRMLRVRVVLLRQRDRLVDEAKSAVLARDEVISAFTQDLKEPLAGLDEVADQLRTAQTPEQVADEAALIKSTVVEMRTIIDDIYDQKKADMHGLTLRLEQMGVADILDEAQIMLQPLAKQRDVNLQFDAVNQSVLAYVDRERVMRVLSNLVGNAVKFSPKHTRVQVKVKSDAQFVNVSVIDSGPGIPENQIGGIFESFWQARRTSDQGPGVGLSIVKTIIEAHGGTVRAENNIKEGTTVTFSLPRRRPANAQLKKPSASGVRRAAARVQPRLENPEGPNA
jgi:signal transduction histidine kinase